MLRIIPGPSSAHENVIWAQFVIGPANGKAVRCAAAVQINRALILHSDIDCPGGGYVSVERHAVQLGSVK
jgi:hypothetical protein